MMIPIREPLISAVVGSVMIQPAYYDMPSQ
jgi:hypothetical protein